MRPVSYEAVVFSGGGCRCFWQAGFWREAGHLFAPRAIAAVSAGAAFACASLGGTIDETVRAFVRRTGANRRNFYVSWLAQGRRPFPHHEMYRDTILETVDADMLVRLRDAAEIRVLLARPPVGWAPAPAAALGIAAYRADSVLRRAVHPRWPRRLGFRPEVVTVGSCDTPEALADLILQSSCVPPLTPLLVRDGEPVVDGGVLDGVPVDVVSEFRSTLVLLTRRYRELPVRAGVRYLQPSQPIPIKLWDYASPHRVEAAFDLGRRDGESFARAAS